MTDVSATADLVERLTSEGLIDMRQAAALYGAGTHKNTVLRHVTKGVKTPAGPLRLEAIRCGGSFRTSRAAVLRFLAAQNAPATVTEKVMVAPAARSKRAQRASAEVDALLSGSSRN